MMRATPSRSPLLAPLAYLAALVLLIEEWSWDAGARLATWLGGWAPLRTLEARIRTLPPYAALAAFVLPGVLLLPVKLLALLAIAQGHAGAGIAIFVAAKLGGAAIAARLYLLTRPALLALGWFARLHDGFVALKDRLIARLRATHVFRRGRRLARIFRRLARRLRRYIALWRARRRHSNGTKRP